MKKKLLTLLLTIAMAITLLVGCGNTTSNSGSDVQPVKIGILMFDFDGDQGKNVKAYCEELSKVMEVSFVFVKYQAGGSDHLDCVDQLITQGVDVIITTFADSGMDVTIKTCEEAGVYLAHYAAVPSDADYEILSARSLLFRSYR